MKKPIPRPYQRDQLWEVFHKLNTIDSAILQSPTGTGKGYQMAYIFHQCLEKHKRVMFVVYGRAVVDTFCEEIADHDIPHTKMMAGHKYDHTSKAVVASISSLWSWYFKKGSKHDKEMLSIPDYILVDECRKITSKSAIEILKFFESRGSKIIGFDATPKNKNLSQIYQDISTGKSTPWHIEQGNLVPISHYAPSINDAQYIEALKNVRTRGNDYVEKDLEKVAASQVLIGDLVTNYERISMMEYGELRSFVVACVSRNHAKSVQQAFQKAGHKVAYVDGDTKSEDRHKIFDDIRTGKLTGIISVLVMIYGVNVKPLEIAILARPTKDVNLLLQFGGRVLRPSDETGKTHAVFIDHTTALQEIGFIDDEYTWSVEDEKCVNETRNKKKAEKEKENVDITCTNCGHVYSNRSNCPKCGEPAVIKYDEPNVVYYNTDLIRKEKEREQHIVNAKEREQFTAELKKHLDNNDKLQYHEKLNKFNQVVSMKYGINYPPAKYDAVEPSDHVSGKTNRYIKYVNIRTNYRRNK